MIKQISIIGCGWLGFPLAKKLTKKGYTIKGSTTSTDKIEELKSENIQPFLIRLNTVEIEGDINRFLEQSDLVIINVPPGLRRNPNKNHVREIELLVEAIIENGVKNVIYVSSTSVFKDEAIIPTISDIDQPNNFEGSKQLIDIENLLMGNNAFNTCILRFGGLIDETRHPGNYLAGKTDLANPDAPINLIHKEDCIAILSEIVVKGLFNTQFNAVYPHHASRSDYYKDYASHNNLKAPQFKLDEVSKGKIVDSLKLVRLLNYEFKHAP
ncbi:NAD(P)-binding domain-containing protein [Winogradskyella poriferorum]|uniref:NAD(P)-binding domain-containing protein n=1 Tax=Winogradskyella poriferorum TaxID=307627 RepID=UPI003D658F2F